MIIRTPSRKPGEHRPRSEWQDRALAESNPQAALTALMALARTAKRAHIDEPPNIDSPLPSWSAASPPGISIDDARLRRQILEALDAHTSWAEMSVPQKLTALRVMTLAFLRIAPPDDEERAELLKRGQHAFPAKAREINSELAALLVYLQDPTAAERIVPLLEAAPTQEEQIDLAKTLRHLHVGWTPELQKRYFEWFVKASGYRGGASFATFVQNIRSDAIAGLSNEEKETLKPVLEAKLENQANVISIKPRPFVRKWSMQELVPLVQNGLKNRDFDRGRKMFAAANCFACHRFDNQGGAVGPDLTSLAGRFSSRDILESVVEPNKQISDQYAAVQIITLNGKVINGRIVNLAGDSLRVMTNMLDPNALERVDRKQIDMIMPSKVSMMPAGLLDTLHEDELLDLMAYLLSRGDRNHALFKP